jgi:hypothetical protein
MVSGVFSRLHFSLHGFRSRAHSEEGIKLRDTDPERFPEREVFRSYPAEIEAVGFKLHYTQARSRKMW